MATYSVASIMSLGRLAMALCSAILGALHKFPALPYIEEEDVNVLPSMVEAELPHLPEDVLIEILSRLEIPDLLRASSVCSSWHSAYTTLDSLGQYKRHQTPCLFYTSESAGKNVGCIYSLAEQRTYKITLPDPPIRDRYLIGSSDGWLDHSGNLQILNAKTQWKQRIWCCEKTSFSELLSLNIKNRRGRASRHEPQLSAPRSVCNVCHPTRPCYTRLHDVHEHSNTQGGAGSDPKNQLTS
uniref:F-box domain-containing protein n=1 Tax=Oryza punctata TaxID=4537 RepID=A0A0E0K4X3_ORYPU